MSSIKVSSINGPLERGIITKLKTLNPISISVYNDSAKHAHHAGVRNAQNKVESHFTVDIVSDAFKGLNLPSRHRLVYSLLSEEFDLMGLHALSLRTKTVEEENRKQYPKGVV